MENNIQNDIFDNTININPADKLTESPESRNVMNDKEVMSNIFDIANEMKGKKQKKQTVKQEKNEEQKSVMRDRLKNARDKKQSMANRLNELENLLKEKHQMNNHVTIPSDIKQEIYKETQSIEPHISEPPIHMPKIELPIPEQPKPQISEPPMPMPKIEPPKPQISDLHKHIMKKYFKIYQF